MITLKRVGFLPADPANDVEVQRIRALMRPQPGPHEGDILAYLRSAPILFIAPEEAYDLLDPEREIEGGEIRTDGVWMWPVEFAHYVGKYHFAIPDDFLRDLSARGWQAPTEDEIDIVAILKNLETTAVLEPAANEIGGKHNEPGK